MKNMVEHERDIQRAILDYLSLKRIVAFRINSGAMKVGSAGNERYMRLAPRGTPDILGYTKDGHFLAIEVKRKGGTVSTEQQEFIDGVNRAGGIGLVAYSLDDVIKEFNAM